jgi:hypothetical protein
MWRKELLNTKILFIFGIMHIHIEHICIVCQSINNLNYKTTNKTSKKKILSKIQRDKEFRLFVQTKLN